MNMFINILITKRVIVAAVALCLAGGCSSVYPPLDVVEDVLEEASIPEIEASVYTEKLKEKRVVMFLTATII